MLSQELIKQLKDYPPFKEFQNYIGETIDELNSIDGLEKMTNEEAGEEAKVRAKTVQKLKEILMPFLDFREKRDPTIEEVQRAKDRAGL